MVWVLWWSFGLACVLVVLVLPWSATDAVDRERHGQKPAETDEALTPVRPSEMRLAGTGYGASTTPGQCLGCGTDNDPCYTYCRECLARL